VTRYPAASERVPCAADKASVEARASGAACFSDATGGIGDIHIVQGHDSDALEAYGSRITLPHGAVVATLFHALVLLLSLFATGSCTRAALRRSTWAGSPSSHCTGCTARLRFC
jgi:hypothetical protein